MMCYGGGDILLAGAAVAGYYAAAWSLCLQTVCSDLKNGPAAQFQ